VRVLAVAQAPAAPITARLRPRGGRPRAMTLTVERTREGLVWWAEPEAEVSRPEAAAGE
jgi:hypothetical protein